MNKIKLLIAVVILAVLFLLPFLGISDFYIRFFAMLFMYISFSVSWNWLGGYCGYPNLGSAAFFGAGAYFSALMAINYMLPQFYTAIFAGVIAVIIALAYGSVSLRFRGVYFAIVSIVLLATLSALTTNLKELGGGKTLFIPIWDASIVICYEAFLIITIFILIVTRFIRNSRFGWGFFAIREDELTAFCIGVPVVRYKILALILGSFFQGILGAFYTLLTGLIYPSLVFNINMTLFPVIASFIGGPTYFLGPVIGSIVLFSFSYALSYVVMSELYILVYGLILVIIIVLQPKGLARWIS